MKYLRIIIRVIWHFKWPLLAIAGMTWGVALLCAELHVWAVVLPIAFAIVGIIVMLVAALLLEVARLG